MASETIDYAAVLGDLEAKRAAIDAAIAGVRQMLNLGAEQSVASGPSTSERRDQTTVRFDSFFRMSMPAAIVKFLEMTKTPQSVSDVTSALQSGGFKTTSKNLMPIVGSNLSRLKTNGELVNVEGKWGLASWYPAVRKAEVKTKKPKRAKAKRDRINSTLTRPALMPPDAGTKQETPTTRKTFTAQQIEEMKEMHTAGKTFGDIGKAFGVHHFTIMRALGLKK